MRRTIILLLIALILPSASAQDFLAFGDQTIILNQCDATTRTLSVQNTAQESATYSISIDGEGADFATFSDLAFSLESGQIKQVTAFYNIPCSKRPGNYPVEIYFSDGNIEKLLEQQITIQAPDNINLTTTETTVVIAPCETASYNLILNNPLNLTEIYTITAEGHPNVHISEPTAVVFGRETKNIILSVTPEDCAQSGQFKLKTEIEAEKTGLSKEIELELIIKSTDIPVIASGVSTIRTDYTDSTADLSIQNTGDRSTTYILEIEGADWASITPGRITLSPGQTQTVSLRLAPEETIPTATYSLLLTATVEQTGIQYSKDINIKLKPQTAFEKNPVPFIAGAVIVLALIICAIFLIRYIRTPKFKQKWAAWKAKRALLKKQRAARRAEKKKLREQKRREKYQKKLEEQKKRQEKIAAERARLKAQVEKEYKKQYHLVSRKEVIKGTQKKNIAKIAALILGALVLAILFAARNIFAANTQYIIVGIAVLLVIYLAKKLANSRVIKKSWKLLHAGKEIELKCWKTGLSQISLTTKEALKQFRILIRKRRAKTAPSPYVYQTTEIKTNVPQESTSLSAAYSVSKSWLKRKQFTTDELRLARYSKQKWQTIPLTKTGEDKKNVYFTAEIKTTGTYSLYVKPSKKIPPKPKLVNYLIALAVIAAIAVLIAPRQDINSKAIPTQTWEQDKTHNIDLSQYFNDPDGDKLTFTATETSQVIIEVIDNTAYLTPQTGWTGEELVRFIADDGKGGTITSNSVKLTVKNSLIPASAQPYIALVVGIIAVLLLLFIVRDLTRSKKA